MLLAIGLCIASASVQPSLAQPGDRQPIAAFRPGEIWLDTDGVAINAHGAGILLHDGVYYMFGEHKVAGEAGNTAQVGVAVYASSDLYNWKNSGIALPVSDSDTSDIARGSIIERPKVIFNRKTGKFVMWFHLELKGQGYSSARTAVAVADRPEGPYRYLRSFRPHAGKWPINVSRWDKQKDSYNILARDFKGGQMSRDMTLFVDDDGKGYLIGSSEENNTLHISELTDDFLDVTGRYVRAMPSGDNEAPTIFKRKGRYYMITSGLSGWDPNAARSFVSNSVFGPWRSIFNPVRGSLIEKSTTFGAQSTFVLPYKNGFIFLADKWNPKNQIDSRYVWLPIVWEGDNPTLHWRDSWTLDDPALAGHAP
jgi:hypothetical protein